jgi:hypothetical protein
MIGDIRCLASRHLISPILGAGRLAPRISRKIRRVKSHTRELAALITQGPGGGRWLRVGWR